MKARHHLSLAIALAAGGVLLGRAMFSSGDGDAGASTGNLVAEGRAARPERQGSRSMGKQEALAKDLAALRARLREKRHGRSAVEREMERMTPEALRALAMEQRLAWLDAEAGEADKMASQTLMKAALEELRRREGTGALEWAAGLPEKAARNGMMRLLLQCCLRSDPDAARPWLEKYAAVQGVDDIMVSSLLRDALSGAVEHGADEVVRVKRLFAMDADGEPLAGVEYPADFDFAELFAGIGGTADLGAAMSQWAGRDRQAAWQAMKALGKDEATGGRYFGAMMMGAVARDGEAEGVRWAMDRLDEVSGDGRSVLLRRMEVENHLSPQGLAAIASRLPAAEAKTFIRSMMREAATEPKAYEAMATLPRGDLLELLAAPYTPAEMVPPPDGKAANQKRLASLQARFSLTEEEMAEIRKASATDGAGG